VQECSVRAQTEKQSRITTSNGAAFELAFRMDAEPGSKMLADSGSKMDTEPASKKDGE
jgi:hypothetical protein